MAEQESRDWMYRRTTENGLLRIEFVIGVEGFIKFCLEHPSHMEDGRIRCPCVRCHNTKYLTDEEVAVHLGRRGFVQGYTTWIHQGEVYEHPSQQVEANEMSGLEGIHDPYVEMVHNAMGTTWREESPESMEEEPNAVDKKFFDMLEACNKKLWSGCEGVSQLGAVARLLNIKAEHNLSEKCFDAICEFVRDILPEDNHMVPNFYETKKLVAGLGLPYEKIDACVRGCILYRGPNKELTECPKCYEKRFKDGKTTKIPRNYMFYFPLTHSLKRLYHSRSSAGYMTWHQSHSHEDEDEMCHPCDSEAWKDFDKKTPHICR